MNRPKRTPIVELEEHTEEKQLSTIQRNIWSLMLNEKMLESRPEDALVKLVKLVKLYRM